MAKTELQALITLLNDPDESVYKAVETRLLDLGNTVLPQLKNANSTSNDSIFIEQSSSIISQVEFNHTFDMFKKWVKNPENNLFEGAFWVAKYIYPEMEYQQLITEIDSIAQDGWLQMNQNLTPMEQIKALNHVIYNLHKYKRQTDNFYNTDNSCINKVIEKKQGNPVSLAILYLTIARKLGMPAYGVNLPRNFLVAYVHKPGSSLIMSNLNAENVSFYINPYQDGAILTKYEIEVFLKQQKIEPTSNFFSPCDDKIAIQRLLLNLFILYKKNKDVNKIQDIKLFIKEFKNQLPDYNL